MFLTMGVALFTSRVVLQTLGVEDYGVYNVVAGFVTMFTFINSALASATQRYITYAIGQGDNNRVNKVFCTSLNIHLLMSIVFVMLAEIIGVWFLNTYMNIPTNRMFAANILFQLAVFSTLILFVSAPYNALIIAHERMTAFAYISILDVSVKLLIVYMLHLFLFDRLIVYAVLMCLSQVLIRQIYTMYCRRNFSESKFRIYKDKTLFKEMLSFSSWSLFGNLAVIGAGQGVNIVLNLFFGPAVNAARGITAQVQNAILGFSSNFQMALNPQITKTYAAGDLKQMHTLVLTSSKYSFYLLYLLSLPIILEADVILKLWLGTVPEYTANFVRIGLLTTIINSMAGPFSISAQANGKIKLYQTVVGGIMLLTFPVAYIGLKYFHKPEFVYVVEIIIVSIAQCIRIYMMRSMIKLSIRRYISDVVLRVSVVFVVGAILPTILFIQLPTGVVSVIYISFTSVVSICVAIYYLGINTHERMLLNTFLKNKVFRAR